MIDDELFMRPRKLKIFISSKMRGGCLQNERLAAADAVDSTAFAETWTWERQAAAGPICAEILCLGHARTSDGLVLLLADELTSIVEKEYEAALNGGAACYVFLMEGVTPNEHADQFVTRVRQNSVTAKFRNVSELRTQVIEALVTNAVRATRIENIRRRQRRATPASRERRALLSTPN